jgi:hypothetical protein
LQDDYTAQSRIVAEAETFAMDVLLTCDEKLIKRLANKTKGLKMQKPQKFWESLKITKKKSS